MSGYDAGYDPASSPWPTAPERRGADLDGYDRARDEARDTSMDRMERESAEDERREIERGGQ